MAPEKPKKNEKSLLLALLLFIGAVALLFFSIREEKNAESKTENFVTGKTEKFEKSVNKHLMLTNEKIKMDSQRASLENARLLNRQFSSTKPEKPYANDTKLDLSSDNTAAEMAKELGRGQREEQIASPHDAVQKELFNELQMQEYSQAYKEEYARQFVENARRGGYKVILSQDLSRVISVTPIQSNLGSGGTQ
ncbi:MAG: hypothetical protein ACXVCP_06390 [Bdellovibrio sp.]